MAYENIIYEKADGIGRITLNRPEKLNALSKALLADFDDALKSAGQDPEVHVVVIRGAGRAFCAGYDLVQNTAAAAARGTTYSMDIFNDEERNIQRWFTMWNLSKPIIGQIHGYCLAGGNEMAMMCDLIVASEDAQFGYPIIRATGTPPTFMWPYLIGLRKAKEYMLTGDSIPAPEAEKLGLINKCVPKDKLEEEVNALAGRICTVPPDLVKLIKKGTNMCFEIMGMKEAIENGFHMHIVAHFSQPVLEFGRHLREEGLKAALERRDSPFGDYRGAQKES
ncbi:MAG TPA: enoyl-CoA hydratase-related protein [Dehalococcoidia bacterium]|nr:enoyl-CoA hydratase-related protein [Dehalococcoidia bacterium]